MVDVDKAVIAKLKVQGEIFEVLVEPDLAIELKEKKEVDLDDLFANNKIYSDSKKGLEASENKLDSLFAGKKTREIQQEIVKKGDVQITTEHMAKLREAKKKQVLIQIQRNGCDPKTDLPHPMTRIEAAFEDVKYNIDPFKDTSKQVQDILKLMQPILPIKVGTKKFKIVVPSKYLGNANHSVRKDCKIIKETYDHQGNWEVTIEIPAGLVESFFDSLNKATHAEILSEKLD